MMIGAPEDYPVFYFANGAVRGYVYNHEIEELQAWVSNGTYEIYHAKAPFAVALNGTAIKRGTGYAVDAFNVATITAGGGELRVYYSNPTEMELLVTNETVPKANIIVATPYRFNGKYTLRVYDDSELVRTDPGNSIRNLRGGSSTRGSVRAPHRTLPDADIHSPDGGRSSHIIQSGGARNRESQRKPEIR